MEPARSKQQQGRQAPTRGEYFIPELCGPRPVLLMILLTELMVLVYTLASSSLPAFDWDMLAFGSLVSQWVVLGSAFFLCLSRGWLNRLSLPMASAACFGVVAVVTSVTSVAAIQLLPWLLGTVGDHAWWLLRNLLVACVLTGIVLRYFFLQQQLRLREQLELQARLDSLRARIRPHFLFNTLNSIASLIESHPGAAEQAVEDLAELFRASLKESQDDTCVADELRLCELYLGIEQLRLGERLGVEWQVEPAAREARMPSLVLQPLVENAVYHGIAQLPEGGRIRIEVRRQGERIHAVVENPVPQRIADSGGHQMGLSNVAQRLQAIFGADARLEVSPGEGMFRIELGYDPRQSP